MMTIKPDGTLRRIGTRPRTVLLAWPLIVTSLAARAVGTLLKRLPALMTALRSRTLRRRRSLVLLSGVLLSGVLLSGAKRQPVWRA